MDSPCIKQTVCKVLKIFQYGKYLVAYVLKEARSVTMNIFLKKKYFRFKSFAKIELSYVFIRNLFSTAENCMEK